MLINRFNIRYDYILIYYAINVSGNPFFTNLNAVMHYIVFCALVMLKIAMNLRKVNNGLFKFASKDISFFITSIILMMLTILLNSDITLQSYLHFIVKLIGAYLLTKAIDFRRFANIYVNILSLLGVLSIVVYAINLVYPGIANIFALVMPEATIENDFNESLNYTTYVNGGFIYTFIIHKGLGTDSIMGYIRNNGIFWEPGAYQFFLNLALVLLMEKYESTRYSRVIFIILATTILTTGSSTGFLALIVVCITYRKQISQWFGQYLKKYNIIFIIGLCILLSMAIYVSEFVFSVVGKIADEMSRPDYILERIGLSNIDELFDGGRILFGTGVTILNTLNTKSILNNTFAYYLFTFGIFYMSNIVYQYYYRYRKNYTHYIGAFIALCLGLTSEVFIYYPIGLALLFFDDSNTVEH